MDFNFECIVFKLIKEDVVTASALPASWTSVLRELGLDLDTVGTPSGEEQPWNRLLARFERRGFLMVWAQEQGDLVRLRLELALPPQAPAALVHVGIEGRLDELGATQTEVSTQGPPRVTYASVSTDSTDEDVRALGVMLLKLSDYVQAVEQNHEAAPPFEAFEEDEVSGAASKASEVAQSPFEAIGASVKEPAAAADESEPSPPSSGGAFEVIGQGSSEAAEPSGPVLLKAFQVTAPAPDIDIHLTLKQPPEESLRGVLTRGIKQALEVRYDVQVRALPSSGDDALRFHVQSASSSYPLGARDREDMESFFNRLVKFGALGMDLFGALNLNDQGELKPSTRARREHDTLTGLPRYKKQAAQTEASASAVDDSLDDGDSVVLSFSEDTASEDAPLEPQRYDDPRLNRPDATTPLVDLILRHPGFSDRRIGQVLSILLSIDTLQAKQLITQAPCPVSWGLSRERALTFKSAMEGAGAKALLVEPGTFKTR